MERWSGTYKPKRTEHTSAPQDVPRPPASTPEKHGTDYDPTSETCSRHAELWNWFLESLGQEQMSLPPSATPSRSSSPVEAMQADLLTDLLYKCAEYQRSEAERHHKENFETWRTFTRAAVDYAWDEARRRSGSDRRLAGEAEEDRHEKEEEAPEEAPPVLIGLPSDEEALSAGSEKKRKDHMYRQERRERVRRWVKEQRELVLSQREARKHVQVPRQVARTWLDQLRQQAARERSEYRTRPPGAAVPSGEQRRYPWDDYLRERNGGASPKDRSRR